MPESPVTRASLLVRLKDGGDEDAWREFVDLYAPVVYGFARKRGLQDADAADLMQEVLRSVSKAAPRLEYDPARGTFRGWLFTITRNKVYTFLDGQRKRERPGGTTDDHELLEALPQAEDSSDEWEIEYQRRLAEVAMRKVKGEFQPATWEAFWRTAVQGQSAKEAGAALKMSAGAVYVAKSRVLARIKDEVQALRERED